MVALSAIGAIVAAFIALSFYVRKAREYLDASEPIWDQLYDAAKTVVSDKDMPGGMAAFAAAAVLCAGCGCLTGQILLDTVTGRFKREMAKPHPVDPALSGEQRLAFARVVVLAVYFDSLRAPLSGFLLRRIVMPWLADAAQGKPAPKSKIAKAASASRHAISEHSEGRRVLSLA